MFSYEICEIFKNTFFHRTPPVTASVFIKSTHTLWIKLICSKNKITKTSIYIQKELEKIVPKIYILSLKRFGFFWRTWWWWVAFVVWSIDERRIAFFSAMTIVRDPHHRESLTNREQDLNLHITWVQAWLNQAVQ